MNSPWTRDIASSGFQWAYDNRNYLQNVADKMYLNKYRDYQERTKVYKQAARNGRRRLAAKRALDFGTPTILSKKNKFTIPYRGPNIETKREFLHVEQGNVAGKTLIGYLMTDIPLGAGNEDIFRQGSSIYVKGCNLRMGFRNLQGCPMFLNIALIAAKQAQPGVTTPPTANFFRNDGFLQNQRYIDFSVASSARQLHYNNINTEQWTVLHHHRKTINITGDGDIISSRANRGGGPADWHEFNKYVPVNRRITYDSETGDSCTTPIWFVFWVSRWDQAINAAVVANTCEAWLYGTTHFVG